MNRARRGGDSLGVMLLFQHVLFNVGVDRIPPVTLITAIIQVCIFLGIIDVPWNGLDGSCISVEKVWARGEYGRILFGALEHGDSFHLYYNMVSFIWKGMQLERQVGSAYFLYILSVFTSLVGVTLVGLSYLAADFLDKSYYYDCAVGFSGVIFALKVLNNYYWPERERYIAGMNIQMPPGFIVWAELILIQLLNPRVSFIGHLAGILVGLAYITGLVKEPMNFVWNSLGGSQGAPYYPYRQASYRSGSGSGVGAWVELSPVTLCLMGSLIGIYYKVLPDNWRFHNSCSSSYLVLEQHKWEQLFISSFHSINHWHLIYVVLSLNNLGAQLERRYGWIKWIFLVLCAAVLTNLLYCFSTKYFFVQFDSVAGVYPYDMKYKCFMGFTGALLALKVFHSYVLPEAFYHFLCFSFPVPKLIGVIAEVMLFSYLFPQIWLIGNVVGSVTGLVLIGIFA